MPVTDQIPAKEKERAVPDVELYSMLNTALDASDNVRVSAPQFTGVEVSTGVSTVQAVPDSPMNTPIPPCSWNEFISQVWLLSL